MRKYTIWLALRGIALVLVGSLALGCATSNGPVTLQQPQETQTKSVLETCALIQDRELAEQRGCYDVYSFGMSITGDLDMAKKNFAITTNYSQAIDPSKMPSQLTINSTGSQVAFSNGNVSYNAGIGQNSLGNGIMQVIQVAGSNVMVMANMDVTLNINNAITLKPTAGTMLTTPGTLSGILR